MIISSEDEAKQLSIERDTVKAKIADKFPEFSIVDEFVISKQVSLYGVTCMTTTKGLNLYRIVFKLFLDFEQTFYEHSHISIHVFIRWTSVNLAVGTFSSSDLLRSGSGVANARNSTTNQVNVPKRMLRFLKQPKLNAPREREKTSQRCSNKFKHVLNPQPDIFNKSLSAFGYDFFNCYPIIPRFNVSSTIFDVFLSISNITTAVNTWAVLTRYND